MKKCIFFFSIILFLLSCSTNDDVLNGFDNSKKYKLSINVSGFSITEEPLKSGNEIAAPENYFCRYVIYKQDESVLCDETIKAEDIKANGFSINKELPVGKYYIAILSIPQKGGIEPNYFVPSKYSTDRVKNVFMGTYGNQDIYYQTKEFNIVDTSKDQAINIVLEPMWSMMGIVIKDPKTCYIPQEAEAAALVASPWVYGFFIKSKESSETFGGSLAAPINISEFRASESYRFNFPMDKTRNCKVKFVTYKMVAVEGQEDKKMEILSERILFEGDIDTGKKITLEGSIGVRENNNNVFSLSFKGLEDMGTIPF